MPIRVVLKVDSNAIIVKRIFASAWLALRINLIALHTLLREYEFEANDYTVCRKLLVELEQHIICLSYALHGIHGVYYCMTLLPKVCTSILKRTDTISPISTSHGQFSPKWTKTTCFLQSSREQDAASDTVYTVYFKRIATKHFSNNIHLLFCTDKIFPYQIYKCMHIRLLDYTTFIHKFITMQWDAVAHRYFQHFLFINWLD